MKENHLTENSEKDDKNPKNDEESEYPKKVGDYVLIDEIGKGTFSQVTRAVHLITNQLVAVKILNKSKIEDEIDIERIIREIEILKNISHPNIVQIYEVYSTIHNYYIIMEIMEGSDLFDYIISNNFLNEYQSCYFFRQLISVLEYLISIGICHRDIKPENILLDKKKQNIKIIDFGLSNYCNNSELLSSSCGSPCYASPEMISGKPYMGITTDIWSSGIVLYSMLVGALPFDSNELSDLYKQIKVGKFYIPSNLSMNAIDLLKKILEVDCKKRITLDEIKKHPWFNLAKNELYKGVNIVTDDFPVDKNVVKYIMKKFFKDDKEINEEDCIEMIENLFCNKYTATYLICKKYELMEKDNELKISIDDSKNENKKENENKSYKIGEKYLKIEDKNFYESEKNKEKKNMPVFEKQIKVDKVKKVFENKNLIKNKNIQEKENKNTEENKKNLENKNMNENKKEIKNGNELESKKISENEKKNKNEQENKKIIENKNINEKKCSKEKKKILENKNMNENKNNNNIKNISENKTNHENNIKNIQENKKLPGNKSFLENKKKNENINENKNILIKNTLKENKKIFVNKNISKNRNINENKEQINDNVKNITISLMENKNKNEQKDKSRNNNCLKFETKNLNKEIFSRNNKVNKSNQFSPYTAKKTNYSNFSKGKIYKARQNSYSIDISKKNILLDPILNLSKKKNSFIAKTNENKNNQLIYSNFKKKIKSRNKNEENITVIYKENGNSANKKPTTSKINFYHTIFNNKNNKYNILHKNKHKIINSNSSHLYKRKFYEIQKNNRSIKEKSEDEIMKDDKNLTITGKNKYLDLNSIINISTKKEIKKANSQNLKRQKSNSLNKSTNSSSNYYHENKKIIFLNYQNHLNKFIPAKRVSVFNEKIKEINKKFNKINVNQKERNTISNTSINKSKKKSPKSHNIHFFTKDYNTNTDYKNKNNKKRKLNVSKYENDHNFEKNESAFLNINNSKTKIHSRNYHNKNFITFTHTKTYNSSTDKNSNSTNNVNTSLNKQKTMIKGNIINKIINKSNKKDASNNNLKNVINIPISSGDNSVIYIYLTENGVMKKIEKTKKEVKKFDKKEDKKINENKSTSKVNKQIKKVIKTNIDLYK